MKNSLKKSMSILVLVGLSIVQTAPLLSAPTHTSMAGSIMRNGSALVYNFGSCAYTGLKYTLYAGLGLTSVLSYSAKKITDSKVALGTLGVVGTYYGVYAWYLNDFFEVEKKYKPIFEEDVTKQDDIDPAPLIRFVNTYYDKPADEIMQQAATLLGRNLPQDLIDALSQQEQVIINDLQKVRPHVGTFVRNIASTLNKLDRKQEKEKQEEIINYSNNALTESFGRPGPVMFQCVFPHFKRLNLLYWQLVTTLNHIRKMRGILGAPAQVNYHYVVKS